MFDSFLPSRSLASLGPITIQWYGLFAALGALAAYLLGRRLARHANLSTDFFGDAFFLALIAGLIGARLWHVVGDFGYYRQHLSEIPAIWQGGLAFHGGLAAGAATLAVVARRRGVAFLSLADLFVPLLALAEAIGRWGNYFNQELFGRPTALPWGIPIASQFRPTASLEATHFHPTFLYESIGLLLITLILTLLLRWRSREPRGAARLPPGSLLAIFLILSGSLRVGMEQLRIDPVLTIAGVRVPLLVSLLVIILGLLVLRRAARRPATLPT